MPATIIQMPAPGSGLRASARAIAISPSETLDLHARMMRWRIDPESRLAEAQQPKPEALLQRTPAWRQARCGHITASRSAEVVTTLKRGGEPAARKHYRDELVAERLSGQPTPPGYLSPEMKWGIEQEPFARAAYEMLTGQLVETAGFVVHPHLPFFGCSPDGLAGPGMIQIKCPATSTHLAWMRAGVIPLEHAPQMLSEMACTGRAWNDFVSFDPRLPEPLQLFVRRWLRDQRLIAALEGEVVRFDAEVEAAVAELSATSC